MYIWRLEKYSLKNLPSDGCRKKILLKKSIFLKPSNILKHPGINLHIQMSPLTYILLRQVILRCLLKKPSLINLSSGGSHKKVRKSMFRWLPKQVFFNKSTLRWLPNQYSFKIRSNGYVRNIYLKKSTFRWRPNKYSLKISRADGS